MRLNHNKAMNMVDLANPLRDELNEFLKEKCDYKVKVTRYVKHSSSVFPVVELTQKNSTTGEETLDRREQIDNLEFEINIYAKCIEEKNKSVITEVKVAEDIMFLINEFFDVKLGMIRTFCQPTPNLDLDIYRITMRFTCSYLKQRNKFIRR